MDAAVMPDFRRQRRPPPASCAHLQSRQFHADAGNAGDPRAIVADEPVGEADRDRREGGKPWPLRHVPNGGGRGAAPDVQGHPVAHRPAASAALASVRRSMVLRSIAPCLLQTAPALSDLSET